VANNEPGSPWGPAIRLGCMMVPSMPTLVFVLDCQDPEALALFWTKALRYWRVGAIGPYVELRPLPEEEGPELLLQRVSEAKTGKNRMHFDIRTRDIDAEVKRLCQLGASLLSDKVEEDGVEWFVLADPEGNEFCVVTE